MRIKKRQIVVGSLLCVLLVILIIGWTLFPSYSEVLRANWGFSLPGQARCAEVYEKDSGDSFHGDGIRYHVFSYRDRNPVDGMLAWSETEKKTIFDGSYQKAATKWLDKIGVPEEQRPDYAGCAFWYKAQEDNSEILVFRNQAENRLYIVESIL